MKQPKKKIKNPTKNKIVKNYSQKKVSFTISIPPNLHNRIKALKVAVKPLNKKISFSSEIMPMLYDMVAELENTYIKTKKCPECNSDLKLRFGKNGDFLGCSSYPKCKHTEQIK